MEEIEEVNGSGISHSTPKQQKDNSNTINFYKHHIEQSEKYNKLQIVDSDDENSEEDNNKI